jgi:hypothetical protein
MIQPCIKLPPLSIFHFIPHLHCSCYLEPLPQVLVLALRIRNAVGGFVEDAEDGDDVVDEGVLGLGTVGAGFPPLGLGLVIWYGGERLVELRWMGKRVDGGRWVGKEE